jgi:CSLREA domain-containing protein
VKNARRLALTAIGAGGLLLGLAGTAGAATITPNTTSDQFDGAAPCSLREAISSANQNVNTGGCIGSGTYGTDTVLIPAGNYFISIAPDGTPNDNEDGDLDVGGPGDNVLTIKRAGSGAVRVDGGGIDRVFGSLADETMNLDGLTISGGNAAASGGGMAANGPTTVSNTTITGNKASGGDGGGVFTSTAAIISLTNVTIYGNTATNDGGGLHNNTATTTLTHVTVTANTADSDSGAGGQGGGVEEFSGTVSLKASVVAGNTDTGGQTPDCDGGPTSLGGNTMGNTVGCGFSLGTGDVATTAPKLGALASNGGPTQTVALLKGSPALNRAAAGTANDQRGVPRSLAGKPDSGAYERVLCRGVLVNRVGTSGKNTLTGTGKADGLLGLGGNDKLKGLGGNDGLCGGKGNDKLFGGKGKDKLSGQAGKDTLNGGPKNDGCKGGPGKDKLKSC